MSEQPACGQGLAAEAFQRLVAQDEAVAALLKSRLDRYQQMLSERG